MERRITEERITKKILDWLTQYDWTIVSFDFPQSGTGRALHPENSFSKTEGIIIPDIIAVKGDIAIISENKDRFVLSDWEKINILKTTNIYESSINELLKQYSIKNIYYGVGFYDRKGNVLKKYYKLLDFVLLVDNNKVVVNYDSKDIFKS